jgi:hypothetical protein
MRAFLLTPAAVVVLLPWIVGCGAALSPPPEYSWVFDVTVTPDTSTCAEVADATEESYVYGLVVEGDTVSVYCDDSKLANGTLTGKYIAYQSAAPFTERRTGDAGEPIEIEWTLAGNVLFDDQELTTSSSGEETITVFQSEVEGIDMGCEHFSTTNWKRR